MTEIETRTPSPRGKLARFCADESGATAIEYAIMASGIGLVLAATVFLLGGKVANLFTTLAGLFP
jgi:pilus assembly protein Flp/PilA